MSRRNGMWITIICILVVGVSVTRMTQEFVSSAGADTAAITAVTENIAAAQQAAPMEAPQAAASMKKQLTDQATTEEEPAPSQGAGENGIPFAETLEDTASDSLGCDEEAFAESQVLSRSVQTEVTEDMAGVPKPLEDTVVSGETGEMKMKEAEGETEAAEKADEEATEETVLETVKSPLEPAAEETQAADYVLIESAETKTSYTAKELMERLSLADEKAVQLEESAVESNLVSAYATAEQEWILWDRELNIIYNAIRSNMTDAEAEKLKFSELEWLKERDLAADKAAGKSSLPQNQNPDSVKILAEKTRARCYELVSDYEDILERDSGLTKQ